jgi:hypothetical protein
MENKILRQGTSSDNSGNFKIVVSESATTTLVFSYIGYNTQEVIVGSKTSLNIVLVSANKALEEVVVVGYGTQKKGEMTGSIAIASGELLNKRIATNPATMLQGQLPGLQVVQGSRARK